MASSSLMEVPFNLHWQSISRSLHQLDHLHPPFYNFPKQWGDFKSPFVGVGIGGPAIAIGLPKSSHQVTTYEVPPRLAKWGTPSESRRTRINT